MGDNAFHELDKEVAILKAQRVDDLRAVDLVATNLSEKVENLKTLVKVISGLLFLAVAIAGLWRGAHP